jgi:hypothetical protein
MVAFVTLRIKNISFYLVGILSSPSLSVDGKCTFCSSCDIIDFHSAVHIDIEFSHDEVVG